MKNRIKIGDHVKIVSNACSCRGILDEIPEYALDYWIIIDEFDQPIYVRNPEQIIKLKEYKDSRGSIWC